MMFEEAPPPVPAKRGRPSTTTGVKACMDRFYDKFVAKFNPGIDATAVPKEHLVTPLIKGGKHGKMFKELIASWSEQQVFAIIDTYFTTRDTQITRSDYSLDFFFLKAQYLRLLNAGKRNDLTQRQHANVAAAQKAMGGE